MTIKQTMKYMQWHIYIGIRKICAKQQITPHSFLPSGYLLFIIMFPKFDQHMGDNYIPGLPWWLRLFLATGLLDSSITCSRCYTVPLVPDSAGIPSDIQLFAPGFCPDSRDPVIQHCTDNSFSRFVKKKFMLYARMATTGFRYYLHFPLFTPII